MHLNIILILILMTLLAVMYSKLRRDYFAIGSSSGSMNDPPNPPNDKSGVFNFAKKYRLAPQYTTLNNQSASMPDSSFFGSINNMLFKNY